MTMRVNGKDVPVERGFDEPSGRLLGELSDQPSPSITARLNDFAAPSASVIRKLFEASLGGRDYLDALAAFEATGGVRKPPPPPPVVAAAAEEPEPEDEHDDDNIAEVKAGFETAMDGLFGAMSACEDELETLRDERDEALAKAKRHKKKAKSARRELAATRLALESALEECDPEDIPVCSELSDLADEAVERARAAIAADEEEN